MERNAVAAEGAPADVYSLAKTLWIFLSGEKTGFEGQFTPAGTLLFKGRLNFPEPLYRLFAAATSNSPEERPSASAFSRELEEWLSTNAEWERYNPLQWQEILRRLFPASPPARAIWQGRRNIVDVLKLVSTFPDLNHVFFPSGGGLDLDGARLGREPGTIELDFGLYRVVRPKRLIFESFPFDSEWNYFRLECAPLRPKLPKRYRGYKGFSEEILELETGETLPYWEWAERSEDGQYAGIRRRRIIRQLKGTMVIFSKSSTYNRDPSTYDARHAAHSAETFRKYIQREARRITRLRRSAGS